MVQTSVKNYGKFYRLLPDNNEQSWLEGPLVEGVMAVKSIPTLPAKDQAPK